MNPGQWDGYPAERRRLYDLLRRTGWASNVAVLSGDIHSSWAADLPVGAEFVVAQRDDRQLRPHGPARRAGRVGRWPAGGSCRRTATCAWPTSTTTATSPSTSRPERIQGDWWHVDTIARRDRASGGPAAGRWPTGSSGLQPGRRAAPVSRR